MGIVAGVALAAGAADWHVRMKWLSIEYQARALGHVKAGMGPSDRPASARERWDGEMSLKWEQAALHPWLAVEPDTPEPR